MKGWKKKSALWYEVKEQKIQKLFKDQILALNICLNMTQVMPLFHMKGEKNAKVMPAHSKSIASTINPP